MRARQTHLGLDRKKNSRRRDPEESNEPLARSGEAVNPELRWIAWTLMGWVPSMGPETIVDMTHNSHRTRQAVEHWPCDTPVGGDIEDGLSTSPKWWHPPTHTYPPTLPLWCKLSSWLDEEYYGIIFPCLHPSIHPSVVPFVPLHSDLCSGCEAGIASPAPDAGPLPPAHRPRGTLLAIRTCRIQSGVPRGLGKGDGLP